MEIVRVLTVLRRRWRWVLLGILVSVGAALYSGFKVSLLPPKLERERALEYGAASTQVLIEGRSSPLANLDRTFEPLTQRASVYARMISSPELLAHISRASGVPASRIWAEGPYKPRTERQEQEPNAERRAGQLAGEMRMHQLRMDAEDGIPIITVDVIGPTAGSAERLANGAAGGLATYLAELRKGDKAVTKDSAVTVRQLGTAEGVLVNPGVDQQVSVMVAVAVLGFWLLAMVFISNVLDDYRLARRLEAAAGGLNGHGDRDRLPVDEIVPPSRV